MNISKNIKLVLVVVILLAVPITIYALLTPNKKIVRIPLVATNIDTIYTVYSDKDGFLGSFKGQKNTLEINTGQHKITAKSEDYEDIVFDKKIDASTKEVTLTFVKKNATNKAEQLSSNSNTEIKGAKFFANGDWVVARIVQKVASRDSEITVSKKVNGSWQIVTQGTSIDPRVLKAENAPADLIDYVEFL